MQPLLKAVWTRYNTDATGFKTALTGGLWLEKAPQGTSYPFGTYLLVVGRPEYYMRGNFEVATIQFDLYAETDATRQDLYTKLTALYDDCHPAVTGFTSMIMERTNQQMLRDGDQDELFRYIIEYQFRIDNP